MIWRGGAGGLTIAATEEVTIMARSWGPDFRAELRRVRLPAMAVETVPS